VRLIHRTIQEYLSTHHNTLFSRPHSVITEICSTYLNSQLVKAPSADVSPDSQGMPFLEYCSVYWGIYSTKELSDCARSLELELLKENYGEMPTRSLIGRIDRDYAEGWGTCSPFGGLHCAPLFGIVELVTALIATECCIMNEHFLGCTSLAGAAHNRHEQVVEILLGRGEVNPDVLDSFGQTPLSHAAWTGHEEVVKSHSDRMKPTPTNLMRTGERRSHMPLGMDTREW